MSGGWAPTTLTCQDCGATMVLTVGRFGHFYRCPTEGCEATHGADKNGTPLGTPADAKTRELRKAAHRTFDRLWQDGLMSRADAYTWLARTMGMHRDLAHISRFDAKKCRRVIAEAEKQYERLVAR